MANRECKYVRRTIASISMMIVVVLFGGCKASSPETTLEVAAKPQVGKHTNVVLILIDDLSHYGFSTYGSNVIRSRNKHFEDQRFSTPNIDQLAQEGLRVERAFTHPLCENTRIALMSGRENNRNFVQPKAIHESDITFGDLFKNAGYKTGLFGKWKQSRGTLETPAKDYISKFGWDSYTAFDVVVEGQRFINPNLVIDGKVMTYQGRADIDPETGRRWYGPDIFNRHALQFIEQNKDKPFFLYYPMALVHDDHKPTPDTKPDSLFDNFDEATHNKNGHTGDDPRYIADMIEYTDKLIGNIVGKLETLSLREETLIIVMGDNGTKEIFAHVMPDGTVYPARKGGNADNGTHVGMVLSQPSVIPRGTTSQRVYDGLVYLTDVLPTMLEASSIENPSHNTLDGISFWPQVLGTKGEHRQTIHSWYIGNSHFELEQNIFKEEYVFDKHFKRYAANMHFPEGRFFDLRTDLFEHAGDRSVPIKWSLKRYSGLKLDALTDEQRQAYERLGKELESQAFVRAKAIHIVGEDDTLTLQTGQSRALNYRVEPVNTTRDAAIWKSSNPDVASIDKFGVVTAHAAGQTKIELFSWDDANPVADGRSPDILRDGLSDTLVIEVH